MLFELTPEFVAKYDVAGPRYTSYPTVPVWKQTCNADTLRHAIQEASRAETEPLSLYFHIPFCKERCTFCGCNVVIAKTTARADPYLDALLAEMDLVLPHLGQRKKVSQLHFGGGTPTFLDESQLERLWHGIQQRFQLDPAAEVAIEIDPVVTSAEKIKLLRKLGFNRISLGVQDFDQEVQAAIDRPQTIAETEAVLHLARELGFSGINFDLIYGLPLQTLTSWTKTMDAVLHLRPDRLAVYSFAYVPQVKPHQKRLEVLPFASGLDKLALFKHAYERLLAAGYQAIGMDHFALPADELSLAQRERRLTRNFQGYGPKRANAVLGFGVSAISDVAGVYTQNVAALTQYFAGIEAKQLPVERGIVLSADDLRRREVIRDLMCNFWCDLGSDDYFAAERRALSDMATEGLLQLNGHEVELLPRGRVFVRNIAMLFDAYLKTPQQAVYSRTV